MGPGDSIVDGPLVDGIEIPAGVQCAEVWPEVTRLVAVLWIFAEREDANVTRAHKVDTDSLKTVVCFDGNGQQVVIAIAQKALISKNVPGDLPTCPLRPCSSSWISL